MSTESNWTFNPGSGSTRSDGVRFNCALRFSEPTPTLRSEWVWEVYFPGKGPRVFLDPEVLDLDTPADVEAYIDRVWPTLRSKTRKAAP